MNQSMDQLEEDDPLYDRDPFDEDYASVASESSSITPMDSKQKRSKSKYTSSTDPSVTNANGHGPNSPSHDPQQQHSKSARSPMTTNSLSKSKLKVLTTNFDKPNFSGSSGAIQPTPYKRQRRSSQVTCIRESALIE
jgi:hypothetical protein